MSLTEDDLRQAFLESNGDSDRAAAIVAVLLIEMVIDKLLTHFNFEKCRRPTLLEKVKALKINGAISGKTAEDIRHLTSIRSKFAHDLCIKFDDNKVLEHLEELIITGKEVDPRRCPRAFYQDACYLIAFVLLVDLQERDAKAQAKHARIMLEEHRSRSSEAGTLAVAPVTPFTESSGSDQAPPRSACPSPAGHPSAASHTPNTAADPERRDIDAARQSSIRRQMPRDGDVTSSAGGIVQMMARRR